MKILENYRSTLSILGAVLLPLIFLHCASEDPLVDGDHIDIGQGYALKKDTSFVSSFPPEGQQFEDLLQTVSSPNGDLFMLVSTDMEYGHNEVWKYDILSDSISSIGAGWGFGPGEMLYPRGIAVDETGVLYVSDWDKWVHMFDGEGRFINKFAVAFQPNDITVDTFGSVYLVGLYDDKLVHKYDRDGILITSFSDAYEFEDPEVKTMFSNGKISNGNIHIDGEFLYMTLTTPYLIRKFALDGEQVEEVTRLADFFTPPQIIRKGTTTYYPALTASVFIATVKLTDTVGVLINGIRTAEGENVIDVLDAKGTFIKTDIHLQGRIIGTDGGNNLYLYYPTGSLVRYSLDVHM